MAKLVLDLHPIYNKGKSIDSALNEIIEEAVEKKIKLVEIIPGKGSGQLKKKVIRFLKKIPRILGAYLCILGFDKELRVVNRSTSFLIH